MEYEDKTQYEIMTCKCELKTDVEGEHQLI